MWHHLYPTEPRPLEVSEKSANPNRENSHVNKPKQLHVYRAFKGLFKSMCVWLIIIIVTLIKHSNNPPSSHSYLLPGPRDSGRGTVLRAGRFLPLCGPPASTPLLGHRPERPVHQSLFWQRGGLLALLPLPPEEHEWQEARLSGVASDLPGPPQAQTQPGGALWVLNRSLEREQTGSQNMVLVSCKMLSFITASAISLDIQP